MRECLLLFSIFWFSFQLGMAQSVSEIRYPSTADQTEQPAMFYAPDSEEPVPLVVALHSWSSDYTQTLHADIEVWCLERGWAYIHPDFRGRNRTPEATGSELVVRIS